MKTTTEDKELLYEIDTLLARLEDFTHGSDGKEITSIRKKINTILSQSSQVEEIRSAEAILLEYVTFEDVNQSETVELLPLTIVDAMEEYGNQSPLSGSLNKTEGEKWKEIDNELQYRYAVIDERREEIIEYLKGKLSFSPEQQPLSPDELKSKAEELTERILDVSAIASASNIESSITNEIITFAKSLNTGSDAVEFAEWVIKETKYIWKHGSEWESVENEGEFKTTQELFQEYLKSKNG